LYFYFSLLHHRYDFGDAPDDRYALNIDVTDGYELVFTT